MYRETDIFFKKNHDRLLASNKYFFSSLFPHPTTEARCTHVLCQNLLNYTQADQNDDALEAERQGEEEGIFT